MKAIMRDLVSRLAHPFIVSAATILGVLVATSFPEIHAAFCKG